MDNIESNFDIKYLGGSSLYDFDSSVSQSLQELMNDDHIVEDDRSENEVEGGYFENKSDSGDQSRDNYFEDTDEEVVEEGYFEDKIHKEGVGEEDYYFQGEDDNHAEEETEDIDQKGGGSKSSVKDQFLLLRNKENEIKTKIDKKYASASTKELSTYKDILKYMS